MLWNVRKRAPCLPLIIINSPLEILTESHSLSCHIAEISCMKATKLAGEDSTWYALLPHHMQPLLEYAAPVWDPHYMPRYMSNVLEKVQHFSLRISSKQRSVVYESLIVWSGQFIFENRRMLLSLSYFAQILHDAIHHTHTSMTLWNSSPTEITLCSTNTR